MMKIEIKTLAIILLSMIVFAGCKKDKKEDSFTHYINYDGKMYPVDKGALENFGPWDVDKAYNLDLYLLSSGLQMVEVNGVWVSETGKGHMIYFQMYANSATHLDDGTYEYDFLSGDAGTFDYGWVLINWDADNDTWDIDQDIEGGTVTIAKSGDVYEITINCTDEDGKSITGYYKGTLKYYDYEKKKSTTTNKRKLRL